MDSKIKSFQKYTEKLKNNFRIHSERVKGIEPKKGESSDLLFFYVRIYLEQVKNSSEYFLMEDIELVKYELHPTFVNRIRIANDLRNNFEIKLWTYGFFDVSCKIFYKGGRTEDLQGLIKWEVTEDERKSNKDELSA